MRNTVAAALPLALLAGAPSLAQKGPDGEPGGAQLATFQDCDECPEMIELPPGSFLMGAPASEAESQDDERPQHAVTFAEGFAIGRYEVTLDEWDACAAADACEPIGDDEGWGRGRRPVINVTWEQARAYADWLTARAVREYRLPTEAEWEYAARAGTTTRFAYGDQISSQQANYNEINGRSEPVGSFPANPWGLHDMHGNVWEWVEDCYNGDEIGYRGAPIDGSAWIGGKCASHVYRGGGWATVDWGLRSAHRGGPSEPSRNWTGFRVAAALTAG